ncbi:MAG: hypothetical protein K8R58_09585 [Bacteroidales bacterium]|nr:hypothetical protein [Bacteroidales bacterium]
MIFLDKISYLFKLRNNSVHLTPEEAAKFEITIEQLLSIWEQTATLIKILSEKEKFEEASIYDILNENILEFKKYWVR